MQTANFKTAFRSLSCLAVSFILFSFSKPAGGEGFEIYLNSKVVMQRFGGQQNTVQTLYLGQSSAKDQLTVKYYHCGKVGKSRVITLRNEKNKAIKEWKFTDNSFSQVMTLNVKDILSVLNADASQQLSLHYKSSELSTERKLARISKAETGVARL